MLIDFFWVFLSGASPIGELRAAIPLGIIVFGLSPALVYLVALLGNFIVVPPLLIFLKYFSEFLMHRYYFFNRFLNFIFSRTRAHHEHKFEKWEHWALLILVAIPLPLTGAWIACLCAFLFDIPFRKALWLILGGLMVAGFIMVVLSFVGAGLFRG